MHEISNVVCSYWTNENREILSDYGKEGYPLDVYFNNELIKSYVNNYIENIKKIKDGLNKKSIKGRLIRLEEVEALGCTRKGYSLICKNKNWINSSTYWTSTAATCGDLYVVSTSKTTYIEPAKNYAAGLRPVITISKSEL